LSSRPQRTRISCYAAVDRAACAAFREESRMKLAEPIEFNRKSGGAQWRDLQFFFFSKRGVSIERRDSGTSCPTGRFCAMEIALGRLQRVYGRKEETALPDAITKMTWSRFFDEYEPVQALVAEGSGQLLGLTHFLFHRSTTSFESVCYLQDLFTVEAARGKGVGRALIEEVYRCAKRAGSPKVYWQTHETNATAMKLYDKVADRSGFLVYRKTL
jgi:GNAT superfamily N-acetyltransferase